MGRVLAEWRERRRAVRELSRLSDDELEGLGMARRDIAAVVRTGLNLDHSRPSTRPTLTWPEIKAVRRSFVNAGLLSRA